MKDIKVKYEESCDIKTDRLSYSIGVGGRRWEVQQLPRPQRKTRAMDDILRIEGMTAAIFQSRGVPGGVWHSLQQGHRPHDFRPVSEVNVHCGGEICRARQSSVRQCPGL